MLRRVLIALGLAALICAPALGCGSSSAVSSHQSVRDVRASTAGSQEASADSTNSPASSLSATRARAIVGRYLTALNRHDAGAACKMMTPELQAFVVRAHPQFTCAATLRWFIEGIGDTSPQFTTMTPLQWWKPYREAGFAGVTVKAAMHYRYGAARNTPAWITIWLTHEPTGWKIAKTDDLISMINGAEQAGYYTGNPPATDAAIAKTSPIPAPDFRCTGAASEASDPIGDEVFHNSGAAPWIDVQHVELTAGPESPCLRITLGAPLRPDTFLTFNSRIFMLDGYSQPAFSGLAGTNLKPGALYGESGTTLALRLDPSQTWSLGSLQVCVRTTQADEPYIARPVVAIDGYGVTQEGCTAPA